MEDIVLDSINSYNDYLGKLPSGCLAIATKLRNQKIQEGLKSIQDFSEGVIWMVDTSILLGKFEVKAEINIEKIHDYLNEINVGLELEDYNLVADLFEYEIAEYFLNCEEIDIN